MRILVDAMGGDNAPNEIVKGCVNAVNSNEGFEIELLGDQHRIQKILDKLEYSGDRIMITNTSEVVTNSDKPTLVLKQKKDSSMMVGLRKLKDKCGHVFISAGSTGALMTGALFIAGRMKGIVRPALAPIVPSLSGGAMIIDAGMNTSCKPINYLQFGILGSMYMKEIYGIKNPRVGLVNVGAEEEKGNNFIQQAFALLQNSGLNFVGNIEGRDIAEGHVDVAVCDGFTGNAMLKMMEGTAKFFLSNLKRIYKKDIFTKLGALLINRELKSFRRQIDPDVVGGTPILGIDGIVFKCHGNANAKTIYHTILKACSFAKSTIIDQLKEKFIHMEVENIG